MTKEKKRKPEPHWGLYPYLQDHFRNKSETKTRRKMDQKSVLQNVICSSTCISKICLKIFLHVQLGSKLPNCYGRRLRPQTLNPQLRVHTSVVRNYGSYQNPLLPNCYGRRLRLQTHNQSGASTLFYNLLRSWVLQKG